MPFNGSGTYNRLYSWAVDADNSVNISSSRTDAEMNGFAAGLSNCVTRDGQSPPSADLPWGGKKITNLGNATVAGDALNMGTGDTRYVLATGATNLTLSGTLTAATLSISGNGTVGGTLGVTGLATLAGLSVSGNATIGGTLGVTGIESATGGVVSGGIVSAYSAGFSSSRAGQTGYHLYNQGGISEWVVYQPAHATDDNLHFATGYSGTLADKLIISVGGVVSVPGSLSVTGASTLTGLLTGSSGIISNGVLTVGGAVPVSFSANQTGQAGYHIYNGGGVAEWLIYQPAHGTDDKLHIAQLAAGTLYDKIVIDTAGAVTVSGALALSSTLAVTGAATLAALTASGLITGNSGLQITGGLALTGALTTGSAANSVGYLGAPQNIQTANYQLALSDMGKSVDMNGASLTLTVPANSSVAFPVGAVIVGTNLNASSLTIAITSDTMTLSGTTSSGSRTVGQNGEYRLKKVAATTWLISGTNLT